MEPLAVIVLAVIMSIASVQIVVESARKLHEGDTGTLVNADPLTLAFMGACVFVVFVGLRVSLCACVCACVSALEWICLE